MTSVACLLLGVAACFFAARAFLLSRQVARLRTFGPIVPPPDVETMKAERDMALAERRQMQEWIGVDAIDPVKRRPIVKLQLGRSLNVGPNDEFIIGSELGGPQQWFLTAGDGGVVRYWSGAGASTMSAESAALLMLGLKAFLARLAPERLMDERFAKLDKLREKQGLPISRDEAQHRTALEDVGRAWEKL